MKSKASIKETSIIIDKAEPYSKLMPVLIEKTEQIKADSEDYILTDVPSSNITIDEQHNLSFSEIPGIEKTFKTTELARFQLCEKLGVPYNYYQRLHQSENFSKEKKELAKENIERMASYYRFSKQRGLMMRTYQDKIRAVLSTSYSVFDSDRISVMIDECIFNSELPERDLVISSYICDFEQFEIRIIHTEPLHIEGNKKMYCGIGISSSDVGMAKLNLGFYIYESLDSNGIYISEDINAKENLFSQVHFRANPETIRKGLSEALKKFPEMKENIKDYLNKASALDLTKSGLYNPKSYNGRNIIKELGLTEKEAEKFIKMVSLKSKTLKNYIMAISQFARQENFKRRHLEKMAGRILLHPEHFGIRKEGE